MLNLLMWLFAIILALVLAFLMLNLLTLPFYFWAMLRGAFYAPIPYSAVEQMIKLIDRKKVKKAVDLGSGDGRIVIALARAGIEAHGYEINPVLVWKSRWNIRCAGLHGKAFIHLADLWNVDLSSFQLVTVYGITHMMPKLEKKLQKELKPGAQVFSKYFEFPNWKPKHREGEILIYESN